MTGYEMTAVEPRQRRYLAGAARHRLRTARMERAARRRVRRRWDVAAEDRAATGAAGLRRRHGMQPGFGVRVFGVEEQLVAGRRLDDAAAKPDSDAIADTAEDAEI